MTIKILDVPPTTTTSFNEFQKNVTHFLDGVGQGRKLEITDRRHPIAHIYNASANPESRAFQKCSERELVKNIISIYNDFKSSNGNVDLLISRMDVRKSDLVLSLFHQEHKPV